MSLQKALGNVSTRDVEEINRIARKKALQKISKTVLDDLDREMLSRMISAYMVLKANGHPDSDFVKYLTTKETRKVLKLGFGAAGAAGPAFLTDGEFRSLVLKTRKQMKKQKEKKEEEQRRPQQKLQNEPDNTAKMGPLKVTIQPGAIQTNSQEIPQPP